MMEVRMTTLLNSINRVQSMVKSICARHWIQKRSVVKLIEIAKICDNISETIDKAIKRNGFMYPQSDCNPASTDTDTINNDSMNQKSMVNRYEHKNVNTCSKRITGSKNSN